MLAQTFVRQEIEGIEALGRPIHVFSVNDPAPGEADVPGAAEIVRSTTYLKSTPPSSILRALFALVRASPVALLRELLGVVTFGGPDLGAKLKRLFHLVEAVILWQACRERGIRHVHAQFAGPTATVAMLAARLGRRVGDPFSFSFIVHGHTDFMDEPGIGLPVKVSEAAFVLCISDFMRSQILRQIPPADWPKVTTLRVGIDIDGFDNAGGPRPVSADRNVLTVGRLAPEKGHTILFEALAELRGRGLDVRLTVIGDGPMGDEMRALAAGIGVADLVDFVGQQPPSAVRDALAAADLFCMASFAEGIPVSIMEAIAARTPVVTTMIMGIPELIVDGVSGLAVPPGRADAMADAIERCLTDDELRSTLTANALAILRSNHDRRQNLDALEAQFARHVDGAH